MNIECPPAKHMALPHGVKLVSTSVKCQVSRDIGGFFNNGWDAPSTVFAIAARRTQAIVESEGEDNANPADPVAFGRDSNGMSLRIRTG